MKAHFSLKNLGAAVGFGLAALVTLWGGLTVEIPGTGVVTDSRELFVLIGAALTGPVGAIPIGILSGVAGVDPGLQIHTVVMHILGALFVGWAYAFLLRFPFRLPGYLFGWFAIVVGYYFLTCLPLYAVEYVFFPETFDLLGAPGLSFQETILRLFGGWFVEFVLTAGLTTASLALLPRAYRRPLWLPWSVPVALHPLNIAVPAAKSQRVGVLAFRLVAWFSILGFFPLGIVAIFIRNDVERMISEHEGVHFQEMARAVAGLVAGMPPGTPGVEPGDGSGIEAAIVKSDGTLSSLPGFPLLDSLRASEARRIIRGEDGSDDGYVSPEGSDLIWGFAKTPQGGTVVVAARISTMHPTLLPMERLAYIRLAASLLLSAAFGGLVVWLLVGRPMRRLTGSLEEVGAGKFQTRVEVAGMEDEVERVGIAFNSMAANLEGLRTGLEAEIDNHRAVAASLERLLREREALLKEVHHRVKNNLQVVCSLLHLQSQEIRDPQDAALFRESENRVRAMSLIHEKLYRTKDFSHVDLREYAGGLVRGLVQLFAPERVTAEVEVDDIRLGIDTAVPCGLIINELVTNAIIHGFRDERRGTVRVSLRREGEGKVTLSVWDNGVGMPAERDPAGGTSIGLNLVGVLTEQLQGELTVRREGGTQISLRFPVPGMRSGS